MASALISLPQRARRGEVIDITVMVAHPMETGLRPGPDGRLIPRRIIHAFSCELDGTEVFRAELFPAITANPFISFSLLASSSGTLVFRWTDDAGEVITEQRRLTLE